MGMDVVYAAGFNVTKKICVGLASRRRRARSSPPSMTSLDSSTPPSRPQSAPEPTTTMLSCASSTTRTRTEPWLAELENILSNLADEIPKEDTMALLAELADPEYEDGMFPYKPFLDRLSGKA